MVTVVSYSRWRVQGVIGVSTMEIEVGLMMW